MAELAEGLGVVLAVESAGSPEAPGALVAALGGLAEALVLLAAVLGEAWEALVVVLAAVLVVLVELAAGLAALVALGLVAPWAMADERPSHTTATSAAV